MLAALTTIQTVGLVIFVILIVQWALAFVCLMRLYKNKPKIMKMWAWNIIVLLAIIIGPILYLVMEKPNPRINEISSENRPESEMPDGEENKEKDN